MVTPLSDFYLSRLSRCYGTVTPWIKHRISTSSQKNSFALSIRQQQAKPILGHLHQWLTLQRQKVPNGSIIAKAIDYSLKRWKALTRYSNDGILPIENNRVESQIRPWALGLSNRQFAQWPTCRQCDESNPKCKTQRP